MTHLIFLVVSLFPEPYILLIITTGLLDRMTLTLPIVSFPNYHHRFNWHFNENTFYLFYKYSERVILIKLVILWGGDYLISNHYILLSSRTHLKVLYQKFCIGRGRGGDTPFLDWRCPCDDVHLLARVSLFWQGQWHLYWRTQDIAFQYWIHVT